MRPGTTALLDQADAADRQAGAILATVAALDRTPVQHVAPGPVFAAPCNPSYLLNS